MRWNACVHRLDLGPYSHSSFWRMESEPMLTPREKSPLAGKKSSEEDRTHVAALSKIVSPTHYQRAIPAPRITDPTLGVRFSTARIVDKIAALRRGVVKMVSGASIMEADDRQVTTVFTVQPSFRHRHSTNRVS